MKILADQYLVRQANYTSELGSSQSDPDEMQREEARELKYESLTGISLSVISEAIRTTFTVITVTSLWYA